MDKSQKKESKENINELSEKADDPMQKIDPLKKEKQKFSYKKTISNKKTGEEITIGTIDIEPFIEKQNKKLDKLIFNKSFENKVNRLINDFYLGDRKDDEDPFEVEELNEDYRYSYKRLRIYKDVNMKCIWNTITIIFKDPNIGLEKYIIFVYYLIFDTLLNYEQFKEIIKENSYTNKFLSNHKESEHYQLIDSIDTVLQDKSNLEVICELREKIRIKSNTNAKNIHYNYGMFSRYLFIYNNYPRQLDLFTEGVLDILESFPELDYRNELDFMLIYNYVVNNRKICFGDYFYRLSIALPKKYSGLDLIKSNILDYDGCFFQIPIYTNTVYLNITKSIMNSAVVETYGLGTGAERMNNKTKHYRNEIILEYYSRYKEQGLSDNEAYKETYEEFENNFPGVLGDTAENRGHDKIKNIVENYKKKISEIKENKKTGKKVR
jgi:hypothetical protein